jgi:hypothetical protein
MGKTTEIFHPDSNHLVVNFVLLNLFAEQYAPLVTLMSHLPTHDLHLPGAVVLGREYCGDTNPTLLVALPSHDTADLVPANHPGQELLRPPHTEIGTNEGDLFEASVRKGIIGIERVVFLSHLATFGTNTGRRKVEVARLG